MDFRRLRFFVEVVRQGGFSAAARVLFATQPTVSKAVQQLEEELGAQLLQRVGHRSVLTDAGRIVYERGARLLADAGALRAELEALKGLDGGRLVMGFPRVGTGSLFAAAMASFKSRFPGIEFRIAVHTVPELVEQLRDGTLEVAAMFSPAAEDVEFRTALTDEVMALVPAAHPLAARASIRLTDLRDVPLLLFDDDVPAGAQILHEFEQAGVVPRIFARTSQLELLFELAGSGAGIAFLPAGLVRARGHRATRAVPLEGTTIAWQIGFGWIRGRRLSDSAEAWLQHLANDRQAGGLVTRA